MKRVAIIGSGISGLAAGFFLSRRHEVHLFERDVRLGGHTHTVRYDARSGPVALDTGFLVHNERTYPMLVRLFSEIGVATRVSDMCFGVACSGTGLEYSSRGPRGFFAQPRNLLSPSHLRLFSEIVRFNREATRALEARVADERTLGDFLDEHRFTDGFANQYLLPLASAIWSASTASIHGFPLMTTIRFLDNHGLLALTGQPAWRTVCGGSSSYIPKLTAPFGSRVNTGVGIRAVLRDDREVRVEFDDRPAQRFDEVVFACHGDQVLPLLDQPTVAEREVFAGFRTTANDVWLHMDVSVLPTRESARASWNYRLHGSGERPPMVTYDLNRLQGLESSERFFVTLNPSGPIDDAKVIRRLSYRHPLYDRQAVRSQDRWSDVSGVNRTHYCGAYWSYGFHEDGLRSALRVARALGVEW